MPWSAASFASKHNKKLSPAKAAKAAAVANAVLKKTGNEASAIRIANASMRNAAGRQLASKRKYG